MVQGYGSGDAALAGDPRFHSMSGGGGGASGGGAGSSGGGAPALQLYTNASLVWTGDAASPHVEAFVVDTAARRFAFAGSAADAAAYARAGSGGACATVDLRGAHVIPGLIDAHLHLVPGGLSLSRPSLAAVASRRELEDTLAAAARALQPGQWLLSGGGWDESRWGGEAPSAAWIDGATGDAPAWLLRHDAHSGLANTAALRLAGITADTADPPGGSIVRGPDGQPTGLLTDAAMKLVSGAALVWRELRMHACIS